jgi:hypothetical protein
LLSESSALEKKAHELEAVKESNIAIEKKMKEDEKLVAEMDLKKK